MVGGGVTAFRGIAIFEIYEGLHFGVHFGKFAKLHFSF